MLKIDREKITGDNDVVFKSIMYLNEDILKKILECALQRKIGKIKYLNTELPVRQFIEKGKRLDIFSEVMETYIDVEVSKNYEEYIKNRNIGFECKIYCETVHKGDSYDKYKKVNLINIIFDKKNKKAILEGTIKDQYGEEMSNMLTYSEIYIENLKEKYYNKDRKEINKYKYLIMLGLNRKELEEFNKRYGDCVVEKYKKEFEKNIWLKEFEPLFSKEEDERRIRNSEKNLGIKEGIKEKTIDVVKNLISMKMNDEDIAKATELSVEEIEKLRKKFK